ncbi:hypothetical protein SERLA73DRAFT_71342 [Serpula lacrymans var. lacrymans S7.3]|uniref:Uncharacterized protein n=2 Tax=Serpula lacrymans var. lacrymans TaxID=341189 RepID=F8PQ98_SERL3|nr:uncharacterized protein SERLADRAFT_435588 [Serpula lacrymans var. lacrymans S7.9]EGO02199.1 hypothetical protein SERLA73DRAFT_71342 [Serpula lacrymans var. lacrymans S7.3]EGO27822.1 hypothetical protein SERLADRAFT_435588 [Serpula lacrymans var. lacrymans S7.9]
MSFARPHSPPPPMPSPKLTPTPLPSPPPFTPKQSRSRLIVPAQHSPPIPPSLIGSPLLKKTLNYSRSHDSLHGRARTSPFDEDDEFGARKTRTARRTASTSSFSLPPPARSVHIVKRNGTNSPYRSPPPSPAIASPPPPVPPIPSFVLSSAENYKKPVLHPQPKRSTNSSILELYINRSADVHSPMSRKRCVSSPRDGGAMTCMQFFTIHNSPQKSCQV